MGWDGEGVQFPRANLHAISNIHLSVSGSEHFSSHSTTSKLVAPKLLFVSESAAAHPACAPHISPSFTSRSRQLRIRQLMRVVSEFEWQKLWRQNRWAQR